MAPILKVLYSRMYSKLFIYMKNNSYSENLALLKIIFEPKWKVSIKLVHNEFKLFWYFLLYCCTGTRPYKSNCLFRCLPFTLLQCNWWKHIHFSWNMDNFKFNFLSIFFFLTEFKITLCYAMRGFLVLLMLFLPLLLICLAWIILSI